MDNSLQTIGDLASMQATAPKLSGKLAATGNIDKTSQDFESMFMTQMLQPMFESVAVDPAFGGGHAEEVMRGFLTQEYGKIIAKSGHTGIAKAIKNEMLLAQAKANSQSTTIGDQNAVLP